ncbi:unnamed protein product, partial [Mesorhabditis spiculigera]
MRVSAFIFCVLPSALAHYFEEMNEDKRAIDPAMGRLRYIYVSEDTPAADQLLYLPRRAVIENSEPFAPRQTRSGNLDEGCAGNGRMVLGRCICENGWRGEHCDKKFNTHMRIGKRSGRWAGAASERRKQ